MIENNPSNVSSAFEMLLEEVEAEIDFVNRIGSKAFRDGSHDKAKEALERAGVLKAFRNKVAGLRKEWDDIAAARECEEDGEPATQHRRQPKLRKGTRTPEHAYYRPILQTLVDMGGRGKVPDVLAEVRKKMEPVLNEVDYEQLSANPEQRWRNAAQWARNTMVRDGRLKSDSPRGVWEITDRGRAFLESSD